MATNKNLFCRRSPLYALLVATLWLAAGCGPPGPRALLDGKRLLEQGNYTGAVEKLTVAANVMVTNAQAWNYLGLACHLAGQPDTAAAAYQRALKLDHELVVAHFNLGCLYLEQNQPDKLEDARNELTAYTLHVGNSAAGWLKLGTAQLRLRDAAAAEKSFVQSLQLSSNNPEAYNGLGLAELQLNRRREAVTCFNNALVQMPNYAPALLNLAVVAQASAAERPLALQRYRQYLALNPRPADWDAVNAAARELGQELYSSARPGAAPTLASARPASSNPAHSVAANTSGSDAANSAGDDQSASDNATAARPEVVQMSNPPATRVVASAAPTRSNSTPAGYSDNGGNVVVSPPIQDVAPGEAPPKPGFFQRINPFRHEPTAVSTPTPLPENGPDGAASGSAPANSAPPAAVVRVPRYNYVSPAKPAAGNRAQAERFFAQAAQAQHERRMRDAVTLYRAATQQDPSFFEAQSNLGLAAYELGDMTQALLAYEIALAIKPDSFNARFNFALALIKANYILDAAQQLEQLLAGASAETPEHQAMAQLTLANLYSDKFNQPAAARPHYQKVLELDPDNSQATVIRYWLRDHP